MKIKWLSFLVLLTSLMGYLEWGIDRGEFLFQAEGDVIAKLFMEPSTVFDPLIFFPLLGQIILIVSIFMHKPNKILLVIAVLSLSVLLVFMFIIGLFSFNLKLLSSTLPFIICSVFMLRYLYIKSI